MSYASRVYRQRNPRNQEKAEKDKFFTKHQPLQKDSRPGSFFQPKLAINKPGDKYEQEADAVANRVVNQSSKNQLVQQKDITNVQRAVAPEKEKPTPENIPVKKDEDVQRMTEPKSKDEEEKPKSGGTPEKEDDVQRKTEPEMKKDEKEKIQKQDEPRKEEEDKTAAVQTKREATDSIDPAGLSSFLKNSSDNGFGMPATVLKEMNTSFGTDFSEVRIHDSKEAAKMNKSIRAQAFTHGKDIYFNESTYNPQSSTGKKLLAHELTHTIQQRGKAPLGKTSSSTMQREAMHRNLQSGRFSGDPRLEEALDNIRAVKYGDSGEHVRKLQQALIDLGIDLPGSTRKTGSPDGIFHWETERGVMTFQRKCGLTGSDVDGIVGSITMSLFDALFSDKSNRTP